MKKRAFVLLLLLSYPGIISTYADTSEETLDSTIQSTEEIASAVETTDMTTDESTEVSSQTETSTSEDSAEITEETVVETNETNVETEISSEEETTETTQSETSSSETETLPKTRKARSVASQSVKNWTEFKAAVLDPTVTNVSVTADILNTENDVQGAQEINVSIALKNLTIDGNGHTIDFRGTSFQNLQAIPSGTTINIVLKNMTIYGQNFWGPFRYGGPTKQSGGAAYGEGTLTYENITYEGAQLTCSPTYNIVFSGKIRNASVNQYVSPFSNKTYNTQVNQVNIEASNMTLLDNADYEGTTQNAGVLQLYYGGMLKVGNHAKLSVTSNGTGGESGLYTVYLQGSLETGENAEITINTRESGNQTALYVTNAGSKVNVTNGTKLAIHVNDKNRSSDRSIVQLASNTTFTVSSDAIFSIDGTARRTGLWATYYNSVIGAQAYSTFKIDERGTFTVNLSGDSDKIAVVYVAGNGTFGFNNAKLVDLNTQNTTGAMTLISMNPGVFTSSIQKVEAWNKGNSTDVPDKIWNPVFDMRVPYTAGNVQSSVTASSLSQAVSQDLITNYRTQNFQRVRFSYIPDVTIQLDELQGNPNDPTSKVLQGTTNPHAMIVFEGENLPEPTLASPNETSTQKYHVQADEKGQYTYTLSKSLTPGKTIKAKAYLSGKEAETSQKVPSLPTFTTTAAITKADKEVTQLLWEDSGVLVYTIENTGTTAFYPSQFTPDIPDTWIIDSSKTQVNINGEQVDNSKLTSTVLRPNDRLTMSIPVTFNKVGTFDYTGTLKGTSDANRKYALPDITTTQQSFEVKKPTLALSSVPNLDFGSNPIQSKEMTLTTNNKQIIEGVDEYVNKQNWELVANVSPLTDADRKALPSSLFFGNAKLTFGNDHVIYTNDTLHQGAFKLQYESQKGFKLKVEPSNLKSQSSYTGTITWTLVDGL